MEINSKKLKEAAAEKNTTLEAVAMACNIHRCTLYRKMKKGFDNFTVGEMKEISNYLGIDKNEMLNIFFGE